MTRKRATPYATELTALFREKAIEHAVIDIQSLYCDPTHPFARDFGYDFTRHHEVALRVEAFTRACRPHLAPFWILHGAEYMGLNGNEPDIRKVPEKAQHAFCKTALYHQTPEENDPILVKYSLNGIKTPLSAALVERKSKALLLSGVELHVCVAMTALNAHYAHGLDVYIIEDLVADGTLPPSKIRAFIKKIDGAKPVTSAEVLTALHAAHPKI